MRRLRDALGLVAALSCALFGCKEEAKHFTTTVEVMQVRTFGAAAGPKLTDLDLKFIDCPGDARQILRAPKEFSECGTKLKAGDKLKAEVLLAYNAERGIYRNEIQKLGACPLKLDPKDEANYQMVENCSEVKATGVTVGVRCERGRTPALLAKCPWLKRN
jgi:hypothetical protein